MTKNNQPSCTRGNPPTEADKGKIWVYWDGDAPHYIRADSLKEAWVEMFPRLSPRRWAETLEGGHRRISIEDILQVCWEGNLICGQAFFGCSSCKNWRPDCWMEGEK